MPRVRITRNTVAGHRPVMVGEVLDLDEREAHLLLGLKKAEIVPIAPPAPPAADPDPAQAGPALSTETAGGIVKKARRRLIAKL